VVSITCPLALSLPMIQESNCSREKSLSPGNTLESLMNLSPVIITLVLSDFSTEYVLADLLSLFNTLTFSQAPSIFTIEIAPGSLLPGIITPDPMSLPFVTEYFSAVSLLPGNPLIRYSFICFRDSMFFARQHGYIRSRSPFTPCGIMCW